MNIRRLWANFGKLKGEQLELKPGLNIISAPNEWGKSTWSDFIRVMFYGINSGERKRAGHIPLKQKYVPWSGGKPEGTADIEVGGRELRLTRVSKGASPMKEFSAVYTDTGESADGIDGENAGMVLLGVEQELFLRSGFIKQGGIPVTGTPELEKRIQSLITTGDETVSYTGTYEKLYEWQRAIRFKQSGKLPKLTAERAKQEERLERVGELNRRLTRLKGEINAAQQALDDAVREQEMYEYAESLRFAQRYPKDTSELRGKLARVTLAAETARDARQRFESAAAEYKEVSRALAALPMFRGMSADAALSLAKSKNSRLPAIGAAVAALVIAALLPVAMEPAALKIGFALGVLTVGAAAVVLLLRKSRAPELLRKAEEYALLCETERDFKLRLDEADKSCRTAAEQSADMYAEVQAQIRSFAPSANSMSDMQRALADAESAWSMVNAKVKPEGENVPAAPRTDIADLKRNLNALISERYKAEGGIAELGDPAALEAQLIQLDEQIEYLEKRYRALELAMDALKEAEQQLRMRFSPLLNRETERWLEKLTGGRYTGFLADKDFDIRAETSDSPVGRSIAEVSAGTADQIYLALRLAICSLTLPEGTPLILDDALSDFDDMRMGYALEALKEVSVQRQIIMFSCHSREAEYFAGHDDVNCITVK